MAKQVIGVFFGSRSTEHDVSIVTAIASVIKPLLVLNEYEVVPIYIAKDGRWFTHPKLAEINTYTSGSLKSLLDKLKPLSVRFDNGLKLVETGVRNKIIKIDIAFPATHGTHGEDGELMGIFEMANVPYVGCGVASSAVAMDKVLSKKVAEASGIRTPKYISFSKFEYKNHTKECISKVESELKLPLFVKPPHLGSSIGITRVVKKIDLENAIEVALHYDSDVLIEEAVQNLIEVTLPIIGNNEPVPALLERPKTQAEDFFDFDTKYMKGGKKGKGAKNSQGYSELPAKLPKALYDSTIKTGLAVYKAIGCAGIARIDMLIDSKNSKVYFNEVNPLPGSLYSHNWNKTGISSVELVKKLIDYALERYIQRTGSETVFSTSYLSQF